MNIVLILAMALSATTVIENVRVESGAAPIESATVVIDQGRIVSVTPGKSVATMPAQATRVDGTGKVLTAGLIETRSQIGVAEVLLESDTVDDALGDQPLAPGLRVCDGFNPLSVRIPITRAAGVTSLIVSPRGEIIGGTGCWVDLTGTLAARPDPNRAVAMFGSLKPQEGSGGSRGGVWLAIRQAIDDARLHKRSVNRPLERELSLSSQHLEALYPVIEGRLPLVLEANRASDILTAIEFAKAEKIRLVIAGASESWLVARQLKEARVPVIIQPTEQLPYGFDLLNARDDLPALLEQAGVSVIITSGIGDDQNARRLRFEAGFAVANGMSREAAMRAITTTPAEVFDRGASYGNIAAGKRADLVLWSGDPFELSTQVERVWIEGHSVPLGDRQRQLAERYLREHD